MFVVLKGPRRGAPLTAAGLDEIVQGARQRAGYHDVDVPPTATYVSDAARGRGHGAGGFQAQAGHRSIESTRIYLHLTNAWLAGEYTRAVEALEAHDAEVLP